jgi:hypothetical protein
MPESELPKFLSAISSVRQDVVPESNVFHKAGRESKVFRRQDEIAFTLQQTPQCRTDADRP